MKKETYIVASSRETNFNLFEELRSASGNLWRYVSNREELESAVSNLSPRYIFFLHWNWKVSDSIWRNNECVCFHMTDVPYGRGGSPLQNLILNGHDETVLSALRMVDEMDAGPVYIKKFLSLQGSAEEIYKRAGTICVDIIKWMVKNNPIPEPQIGEVTIFKRRKPEQSVLPENGNLRDVYDFIRMLDAEGYPNAFMDYGNYRMKFKKACAVEGKLVAEVEISVKDDG